MHLAPRTLDVRNPRSGEIDYQIAQPGSEEIERGCAGLRAAQPAWQALGAAGRAESLRQFAAAVAGRRIEFTDALARDTGRVAESALEVDAVCDSIERWCDDAPALLDFGAPKSTSIPFISAQRTGMAYELAGVISPWNFPFLLSCVDTIPALLAGCAVAIKPSEITPRFAEPFLAALNEVDVLRDVVGVYVGDGRIGAALIGEVDILCFTGSVRTGRLVAKEAATRFIPVHLELGGKDPAIVLDDADTDRAAAAISWGGLVNAGQSCLSIERVYVAETQYERFLERLTTFTSALDLNIEDIDRGQIGPIISAQQAGVIRRHLNDARSKGALIQCGGELVTRGGIWCQPTVLSNVTHDMLVMSEESFAPVLPVMAFEDDDHAVQLANDTPFGLSAAVFGSDLSRVRRVAARLHAGAISVNDAALTSFVHEGEKQAFKASGLGGSRMGHASIARFIRSQVYLANDQGVWDPWWFAQSPDEPGR